MQSEEEKRRLELYRQQVPRFVVKTGPSRTPAQPAQPPQIPVKTPEYSSFGAKVKDVLFDANTPQDIAKRQAAGQPRLYAEQKRQEGITRPDQNVVQVLFREPLTLGATQAALSRIGLVEFPRFLAAKVTGNKAAEKAVMERVGRITSGEDKRFQIAGVPSAFGQKDLGEKQDLGQAAKRFTGAALGTAGFAIGGGALPKLTQLGGKQGLVQLGKFVGAEAAAGSAGNIGATLTRKPEAGAKELAVSGLVGGAVGAPLALGIGGIARGITTAFTRPAGRRFITEVAQTTDQATIKDSIRQLLPNATDEELDAISRRLAQTTDEAEVQRIIEQGATGTFGEPVRPTPTPTPEAPTTPVTPPTPARPTFTADEVTNLLQGLPETTQAQFADEILNVTSPEQRQTLITRIENAKQQITETVAGEVPEALPVTPVQRQQEALVQAVEQPTAPTRVAPAPVTEAPVQPIPTAVQGAVGPEVAIKNAINQSSFENDLAQYNLTPEEVATVGFTKSDFDKGKAIVNNAIKQIENAKTTDEIIRIANNAQNELGKLNITETLKKQLADIEVFQRQKLVDAQRTVPIQAITPPRSRFAITETAEELQARLRARQAEAPIDQARISPADVAERQALSERQAFVALPTTDFVERLAEQTGISPKWLRRAVDKGYGKDWVYTTALDSVQGAEDVNKVFNNRVKNIKFGVLPAEKNLSPLIGKRVTFKDGTIGKVLDTNTDSTRIQVEMPDGSVRVDVKKSDLQPRGVIEQPEPEIIKQNIPEVTDVNAPFSDTVIVDGNLVNKTTGEILEPPKPMFERVKELPDYDKATVDDFDTILRTRDDLKNYWDNFIKVNGKEVTDKVQEEIFLLDKGLLSPSDASPRTMELYNGYIKPVLDALGAKSRRAGEMGVREFYIPQLRKTYGEPVQVEFGYSTIDKANTEFGSAYRREGVNELQDLAPIGEQLNNYVDQWVYDNYNHIAVASRPEYANTYIDPVNYLRDEEKIIQKLAIKSDDEIADLNKTLEPSDTLIIDDVTDNFQKYAKPEVKEAESIPINGRIPRGASLLEDRELLTGLGIYDEFGFKAYDEADITGKQIFQDDFADIANLNREQIYERLKEIYGNQFTDMPESTDYLIRKRANSIFYDLNNSRKNVEMGIENEVGVPAYHFGRLEKDLAAAKIYHNIQRSVIKDEKVKKLLNKQLEKVLSNNRRKESFFEKVLNQISSTLHTAMLGLKIPTAIQNLTETSRLWGLLDKDVLQQLLKEAGTNKLKVKETLQRIGQDKSVLKQLSDIPTNEKRITASNLLDKVRNGAMAGFDATEAIKDVMFLRGFELQGIKKGLSGRQLGQYIAENYNKYAFKGGQFGSLGFSQNPVGRLLFQFSQYPIKQIKLNSRYAAQALSTDPAVRKEALQYLGKTFGTNAAAYAVLYPIFGWGMQRALGVDLPKFGPAVSLTVELYNIINDELERVNNENERLAEAGSDKRVGYDWENILDRWGRKVAAYPIPGGDWLFNKLGVGEFLPDGYNPFSKNTTIATWQRGYEENYKGQARIEGPQNWFDYGTQFIGGQYNTAAARGYFGNNPFSFTIDIPGTAADIRILSDERLKPLNRAEQQYFENLPTAEAKRDFITQKHKRTRLYQELKKEFGKTLDEAIFGPSYTNTATGERTVLDSSKNSQYKANLLLTVPGLLEAVNALNAENPLPIKDPFLNLIPEHQKQVLAYQALEKNDPRRNVIYSQNEKWMQEFMDARDPYYAQFEIKGEEKIKRPDQFGLNPPELTENIKSLRDRFFQLDGWEARQQFLADNPSLQTYLRDKDTYDRNYNTLSYLPNVDKYPEPDAETQQYLDEYNAAGPAATEGRKAVERSAWIKANPKKWEKVQAFFTQSALWSLQNELALSIYEGIEPSEKAFERIMSIAKGMGAGQFGFGERQYTEEDAAYSRIMNNLKLVGTSNIGQFPTIPKRKRTARFRVQVPSSRRTQQIRLR